jgi:hypothetical protein
MMILWWETIREGADSHNLPRTTKTWSSFLFLFHVPNPTMFRTFHANWGGPSPVIHAIYPFVYIYTQSLNNELIRYVKTGSIKGSGKNSKEVNTIHWKTCTPKTSRNEHCLQMFGKEEPVKPESIKWFKEDQPFSPPFDLAHPSSRKLRKRNNLLMGGGGGDAGRGAKLYDAEKVWYSIKHSILSGYNYKHKYTNIFDLCGYKAMSFSILKYL